MSQPPSGTTRFDRDTAVHPLGEGLYEARIDPAWWIVRGPNGGYLAAILVNALAAAVDDPTRTARSLTVHYTRPPAPGPAQVETRVERRGRSLTTVSARLLQEGKLQALAIGAFSAPRESPDLHHVRMPEVGPPAVLAQREGGSPIPIHAQYRMSWAIGPRPFEGERGPEAISGGWLRLAEPRRVDAALLAAYADAWPPAIFACDAVPMPGGGVPTVDLTVHFRALPPADADPADPVLVNFRSRELAQGFVEEDGEIWSRDGVLLAHSRQLAVFS